MLSLVVRSHLLGHCRPDSTELSLNSMVSDLVSSGVSGETHLFSSAAHQRRPLLLNFVLWLVKRLCGSGLHGIPTTPLVLQLGTHYSRDITRKVRPAQARDTSRDQKICMSRAPCSPTVARVVNREAMTYADWRRSTGRAISLGNQYRDPLTGLVCCVDLHAFARNSLEPVVINHLCPNTSAF